MIQYREIDSTEEMKQIVDLQMAVWSMDPIMTVPHNLLIALVHSGGMVIGADEDGDLVGFALAFPARNGDTFILWSHMAGVRPGQQRRGIGVGLKLAQRDWALAHGYETIAWTYDPLQRGNANFNLCLLGATSTRYHTNFYGEMLDSINAGMPSDRLEIVWNLNDARVLAAISGATLLPTTTIFPPEDFLLYTDANGNPCMGEARDPLPRWHFVEIPYDLASLKRDHVEQAKAWQLALRQTMLASLSKGNAVVDFVTEQGRCWYVLGQC